MTKNLLSLFDLRKIEIEIYNNLWQYGISSASELARKANINRTSVYDLLEKLIQKGLIFQTLEAGIKKFAVQPPEKLKLLIEEKEKNIIAAKKILDNLQNEYSQKNLSLNPVLQLYKGRDSLQQMMKDMLLYRDMTVLVYWPILNIIDVLTSNFLQKFHKNRIKQNIFIKAIWPKSQIVSFKKYPYLSLANEHKRKVRIAPSNIDFSLGYAVYGNTTRFISSKKENVGFLIESLELTEMIRSQFKIIWSLSEPLNKIIKK